MSHTAERCAPELLQRLSGLSGSEVGLHVLAADGSSLEHHGFADELVVELVGDELRLQPRADRAMRSEPVPGGNAGELLAVTWPTESQDLADFVAALFSVLLDKQQIEGDMESMYASSLALLEEVSMMGDMLPKLPTGETEQQTAEMGLRALLVAASAERAFYLRLHPQLGHLEFVVHVAMDEEGRQPVSLPYDGASVLVEDDATCESLLWRAVRGQGNPILEAQPAFTAAVRGTPLDLVDRQVAAVPVRYGAGDKAVTLGVILLIDKRANAYSSSLEMGSQETKLAASVASMLGSVLGTRQTVELRKEMNMGQELQRQILPDCSPKIAGYDLAGACQTHGAIGGDYFDYLQMADGRWMTVIADVSGHNLPSGMVMVSARACLKVLVQQHGEPGVIFDELARSLFPDLTKTERFITAAAVALRPGQPDIEIVNAGHNATMIWRQDTGNIEEIDAEDTVLGFLPAPKHDVHQTQMQPGDVMLIYTDGITEATDASEEMFGEDRLREVFSQAVAGDAKEILDTVFGAVTDWTDSNGGDDVSAVVIKATKEG